MDKIPLNTHQIYAFFLPGLVFTIPSIYCYYFLNVENGSIDAFITHYKDSGVLMTFVSIIISLVGLIFDSFRSGVLEMIFDRMKSNDRNKINWEFFYKKNSKVVGMLYARYYNFYVFNVNFIISILTTEFIIWHYLPTNNTTWLILFIGLAVCCILTWETINLRSEIVHITKHYKPDQ